MGTNRLPADPLQHTRDLIDSQERVCEACRTILREIDAVDALHRKIGFEGMRDRHLAAIAYDAAGYDKLRDEYSRSSLQTAKLLAQVRDIAHGVAKGFEETEKARKRMEAEDN